MIVSMRDGERLGLEQIRAFLAGSQGVKFEGRGREEVYAWVTRTLHGQQYRDQRKGVRGLLRRYVEKMTGRSRAQVTRLVKCYLEHSEVRVGKAKRHQFSSRFTRSDLELLAKVDEAHETMSGPATKKILKREFQHYGRPEYERLAGISASHIYNLRRRQRYRECRLNYTKTQAVQVAIGERRKPDPQGRPGHLRVDTVHQGDQDGVKGVYHINAIDEVTQWQVVGAVAVISQAHLEPVLKAILAQFPFLIRGFHSDNGREYINDTVSGLLKDLLIQQTKSRPRHSNDNGLVESKNAAVIRQHMGYGHIAAGHAPDIDDFYQRYLNPYLNLHRPCGQPERVTDARGKSKFVYKRYLTPLEKLTEVLAGLPDTPPLLKPGRSILDLQRMADARSDTDAAQGMQAAKHKLFLGFRQDRKIA